LVARRGQILLTSRVAFCIESVVRRLYTLLIFPYSLFCVTDENSVFFGKLFFPHSRVVIIIILGVTVACISARQKTFSFIYFFEDSFCFVVWSGLHMVWLLSHHPRKTKDLFLKKK